MIFLASDAPTGRLLKSQLKFHYSGELPVFSTSSVNSMDGRSNSDLNGITFADTPWVVDPQPWIAHLPGQFAEFWPEQRRMMRLHAMGYDAYNLIASLFAARGGTMIELVDLPKELLGPEASADILPEGGIVSLAAAERLAIERALENCDGNLSEVARRLGDEDVHHFMFNQIVADIGPVFDPVAEYGRDPGDPEFFLQAPVRTI